MCACTGLYCTIVCVMQTCVLRPFANVHTHGWTDVLACRRTPAQAHAPLGDKVWRRFASSDAHVAFASRVKSGRFRRSEPAFLPKGQDPLRHRAPCAAGSVHSPCLSPPPPRKCCSVRSGSDVALGTLGNLLTCIPEAPHCSAAFGGPAALNRVFRGGSQVPDCPERWVRGLRRARPARPGLSASLRSTPSVHSVEEAGKRSVALRLHKANQSFVMNRSPTIPPSCPLGLLGLYQSSQSIEPFIDF